MLRFFRRPPRDAFGHPNEDVPATSEEFTEDELGASTERRWRPLKTILAFGMLTAGLGALYLGWSGDLGNDLVPPRLLPHGRVPLTQESSAGSSATAPPSTPPAVTSTPSISSDRAAPPTSSTQATPQPERPTFHAPLSPDPRETAPIAFGQETSPYSVLAQASQEATVENLRSQIAELKLKKLKAELEADELRKNPRRLFKEERPSAELKRESNGLERLARVPPSSFPIQEPRLTERHAQAAPPPTALVAPPHMRVRMVTLVPKEAVIEAGDGDSRGWFTVREGQKFPDFVVTDIGSNGVTISLGGRGFFYPVGSSALGASEGDRQSGPRQTSEPPRR